MKQSTKRLLSSLLSLLLILFAFGIFFILIKPTYSEAQKVRGKVLSREAFLNDQKEVIEQVKKLINEYKGDEGLQKVISLVLPVGADPAGALIQLNGLADNNNIATHSFSVTAPSLQATAAEINESKGTAVLKPVGLLTFQLRFSGTYEDMRAFMKNLETNIRIFDIKNLNLQAAVRPNQNFYAYDITVATYYQNP